MSVYYQDEEVRQGLRCDRWLVEPGFVESLMMMYWLYCVDYLFVGVDEENNQRYDGEDFRKSFNCILCVHKAHNRTLACPFRDGGFPTTNFVPSS
jgi:hypothetical protein